MEIVNNYYKLLGSIEGILMVAINENLKASDPLVLKQLLKAYKEYPIDVPSEDLINLLTSKLNTNDNDIH